MLNDRSKVGPLDLDAIRARVDAATEGPWDYAGQGWVRHGDMSVGSDRFPEVLAATVQREADGVFIAHARTDIPALLAEVERLRAVEALRDDVALLWDWRINQGMRFLATPDDVPVLRALLSGERLASVPGFEWLTDEVTPVTGLAVSGRGYAFEATRPRWWRRHWAGRCTCGATLKPIFGPKVEPSLVLFFMENHAVLEHGRER